MKKGCISIVIPVYNCEDYLTKCLDSVVHQTYKNLEIILINDGSADQTAKICRDYVGTDPRIRYLEQSNHGVAYARKRGVQEAEGEYIGFVDADDYIEKNMYEMLWGYRGFADLVTSGLKYQGGYIFDTIPEGLYHTETERRFLYKNMMLFEETSKSGIITNLVSKLFLADKLKTAVQNTALDVHIGEDAEIVYKYILLCDAVRVTKTCFYHYEYNINSITHVTDQHYLRNVDSLYNTLANEFRESKYEDLLLAGLNRWTWYILQHAPRYMGWQFDGSEGRIKYLTPFQNLLPNKKVVLYGAGKVGKDFYIFYRKTREVEIVLWVDKNWMNLRNQKWNICSAEQIGGIYYDYILIAVKKREDAEKIRIELEKQGVESHKILWKEPIDLDEND